MTGQGVVAAVVHPSVMAAVAKNRSLPGGGIDNNISGIDFITDSMDAAAAAAQVAAAAATAIETKRTSTAVTAAATAAAVDDSLIGDNYREVKHLAAVGVQRPLPPIEFENTQWSTIVSSRWEREEHINSLEMRAAITAIQWTLSLARNAVNSRLLLLSDSTTAVGALSKGRSSSPVILRRCRRAAALLLASGIRLHCRWVPTEWNPADGPSRA